MDSSDFVWVLLEDSANGTIGLSQIARTSAFKSQGLYNPYSENGHTIVNNVVASDHSAWVLDSLISDKNAHIAAALYAPLLQNLLSKVCSPLHISLLDVELVDRRTVWPLS